VYKARDEALETQIKVYMAAVANSGSLQVSTTPKGNVLRPLAVHGLGVQGR